MRRTGRALLPSPRSPRPVAFPLLSRYVLLLLSISPSFSASSRISFASPIFRGNRRANHGAKDNGRGVWVLGGRDHTPKEPGALHYFVPSGNHPRKRNRRFPHRLTHSFFPWFPGHTHHSMLRRLITSGRFSTPSLHGESKDINCGGSQRKGDQKKYNHRHRIPHNKPSELLHMSTTSRDARNPREGKNSGEKG
jgi:hypothetical protein